MIYLLSNQKELISRLLLFLQLSLTFKRVFAFDVHGFIRCLNASDGVFPAARRYSDNDVAALAESFGRNICQKFFTLRGIYLIARQSAEKR